MHYITTANKNNVVLLCMVPQKPKEICFKTFATSESDVKSYIDVILSLKGKET